MHHSVRRCALGLNSAVQREGAGTMPKLLNGAVIASVSFLGICSPLYAQTVSPAETQAIAKDAYVYSYAMTESYQTWRTQAVDKTANGYVGGFNVFRHYSE